MLDFVWSEALKVAIFSLVSVVYLFIISKLLGKKQIAQLTFIDYAIGISIGSIAAEMATDISNTPVYYYLIGMTVFFLVDLFISWIERKGPLAKAFFKGSPETIIYEGKIIYKNMKKSKLDVNDVLHMCRDKGYFDINDIAYAVFETSGKLSILPKGNQKPTVAEDFKDVEIKQASLPCHLVIDGRISFSGLSELGKDKEWLYKQLKVTDKKGLKNILLASYDSETKKMNIHSKEE